jgi:biopolymer transport protein ExbD/biopolymer transport protein TolR
MNATGPSDDDDLAPLAEINVTPLVDVMLVLLIIFMVTAPMLTAGLNVNLPQAAAAKPSDVQKPIVVTIKADGMLSVGAEETARADIVAKLRGMIQTPQQIVHVRGDRDVSYGEVVALLDDLALNGITRLSLIASRRDIEPSSTPPP